MKSLGDVLKLSADFLQTKGVGKPRRTVEELIGHVLGVKRLDLYLQFDRPLDEAELGEIRALLKRAAICEPLDYILGVQTFYGCELCVGPQVLIPRPETELLAERVCAHLKKPFEGRVVWDVCTGSGCLGIAVKKKFPELQVVLSDLSREALEVARGNAARNGVEVECVEGDLLTPFAGRKASVVLCNPPYVSEAEYGALDPSVREFEPRMALVGGKEGLEFYRRLHTTLPPFLEPGAQLFFEMGATQAGALQALFCEPHWKGSQVEKDLSGHDRFFFLEFE